MHQTLNHGKDNSEAACSGLSDAGEEPGYLVDKAVKQHKSFSGSKRPASSLERELILDAVRRSAVREGFYLEEVAGGLDLISLDGSHLRKYRVKRGERTADGYRFVCGLGSTLLTTEPATLYVEERWILGYFTSDDHLLDEVIAAEVVGSEGSGNGPVVLRLGAVMPLSGAPRPPKGFRSTDEGLLGFDDEVGEADIA